MIMKKVYMGKIYTTEKSNLLKEAIGDGYRVELRATIPHQNPFLYIKGTNTSIFGKYDTKKKKLTSTEKIVPLSLREASDFFTSLKTKPEIQ